MVLTQIKDDKIKESANIVKCATLEVNGKWKFNAKKFMNHKLDSDSEKFWNDSFENVLNGPDLFICNRCSIPDTKENLDRGVEHSRIQCEEESYYFKIYKGLSDKCREDLDGSDECLKELIEVKKNTKFQDNKLYSSNHVLRYYSTDFYWNFNIPEYTGINTVTEKWKDSYHNADDMIKNYRNPDNIKSISDPEYN
jgi:hypothetical protein